METPLVITRLRKEACWLDGSQEIRRKYIVSFVVLLKLSDSIIDAFLISS